MVIEAGDFHLAIEKGVVQWSSIVELGPVVVGRATGRKQPNEISLFKSLGIGLEDVVTAGKVVAKAKEAGVGRLIDW